MTARRGVAIAAATIMLALAGAAAAHQVGLSRGDYAFAGDEVTAEIIFARGELASLVPELDANGDGRLTPDEVDGARAKLEAAIVARIKVTAGGAPCAGRLAAAHLAEEDGLTLRGVFRCPRPAETAHVELDFLDDLAHGHRHIARSRGPKGEIEDVLYRGNAALDVPAGAALPGSPTPSKATSSAPANGSPNLVLLGVQRFLREYLHVAFLVAALFAAASRRARLEVAVAFAIGSATGLAVAALGAWTPDARAVGPAIAVSVVYAGVLGLLERSPRAAWVTALAFGGVHGFGLAAAIAGRATTSALGPYELGIVVAELAVAGAAIALATRAERAPKTMERVLRFGCAAAALVGVVAAARALVA